MNKKPPIAVVGMAGIFPGAPDIDTFWHNIINKVDSTCEVPEGRWFIEPDAMYNPDPMPDKAYVGQGDAHEFICGTGGRP